MSAKTTTPQLFIKTPQYIEEVIEGTLPASPTFVSCGPVKTLSVLIDGQFIDVSQIGPEDLIAILQGLIKYEIKMKVLLLNSTFIKYAVNAANYGTPAGTISKSLTIIWSIYLNGVENFIQANGARAKDCTINVETGKADEVDITFECMNITTPSATGPATPTYAATPSGAVWGHLDGGAIPVSIGGAGVNAKKITVTINRNTSADPVLGQPGPFSTQPHGRRISGDTQILWTNTTQEASLKTPTVANIAIVLKTALSTITLTSASLVSYKRDGDADANSIIIEAISFRALSVAIT